MALSRMDIELALYAREPVVDRTKSLRRSAAAILILWVIGCAALFGAILWQSEIVC